MRMGWSIVLAAVWFTPRFAGAQTPASEAEFTLPPSFSTLVRKSADGGVGELDRSPFFLPGLGFDFHEPLPAPADEEAEPQPTLGRFADPSERQEEIHCCSGMSVEYPHKDFRTVDGDFVTAFRVPEALAAAIPCVGGPDSRREGHWQPGRSLACIAFGQQESYPETGCSDLEWVEAQWVPASGQPLGIAIVSLLAADPRVRLAAVRDLANYPDRLAVHGLIAALEFDPCPSIRSAAAQSLGQGMTAAAVPALRRAAESDRTPAVRRIAARTADLVEAQGRSGNGRWPASPARLPESEDGPRTAGAVPVEDTPPADPMEPFPFTGVKTGALVDPSPAAGKPTFACAVCSRDWYDIFPSPPAEEAEPRLQWAPTRGSLMFGLTVNSDAGLAPEPPVLLFSCPVSSDAGASWWYGCPDVARYSLSEHLCDPTAYIPPEQVTAAAVLFTPYSRTFVFSGRYEEPGTTSFLHRDARVRLAALTELSRCYRWNAIRAVDLVGAMLATDPCPSVRAAAVRVLLRTGSSEAITALRTAGDSDIDAKVRDTARFAAQVLEDQTYGLSDRPVDCFWEGCETSISFCF